MPARTDVRTQFVALTDPGIVRVHNEDSVAVSVDVGLALLADGMGGYNAGEVASGLATALLLRDLEQDLLKCEPDVTLSAAQVHRMIQARVQQVNHAIFEAARENVQLEGMGTTLVMAYVHDAHITLAHIGDSRGYRWRAGKLVQVTRDHSLLQEQIDAGLLTPAEARYSQNRNLVTRALGVDPSVAAEINDFETQQGDVYLLCSDGLTDMVTDEQIEYVIGHESNLETCASCLVELANDHGGRDNVSVILIRIDSVSPRPRGLMSKMRHWLT